MNNTWKENKTKNQEKGWASVLSHLCRLIDKLVLAESLWASWVGWLCTSPPFFRDVYVQIRRQESLTCWAGHFAKAPQGILCYTSTLSPRLLCGGTGETRGLHKPICQAWDQPWPGGFSVTLRQRAWELWVGRRGRAGPRGLPGAQISGSEGQMPPPDSTMGVLAWTCFWPQGADQSPWLVASVLASLLQG